jgi:predicted transcriptional regulator YdeE
MQSVQVEVADFSIAGVGAEAPIDDPSPIGQRLTAQLGSPGFLEKITDITDKDKFYSVQANWNEQRRVYTLIYGFPVKGDGVYADDDQLLRVHILGGLYTKFTVKGPMPQAQAQAWKEIAQIRARPNWKVTGTVSFEVYDARARQDTPEIDIYVPGVLET